MYRLRRILVAVADVTLDDGPHFLRRLLARTHGFFESRAVLFTSPKSHGRASIPCPWSFLSPPPCPLPLRAPHSLPLAIQTTKNYVTLAHSTCSCLSLSHRQRRRNSPPVDTDSRPPAPCPSPLCTSTVTLTSYGGPHTVGL